MTNLYLSGLYLSGRALVAARRVDPAVSATAVRAAAEVAVAEELLRVAGSSGDVIRARARELLHADDPDTTGA